MRLDKCSKSIIHMMKINNTYDESKYPSFNNNTCDVNQC